MAGRPARPRGGVDPDPQTLRAARSAASRKAHAGALELALSPLLARIGAEVVDGEPAPGDIPIEWLGETILHVRVPLDATSDDPGQATDLSDGLARLIATVEDELGGPLATLSRAEKQHAVRLLEERGAFEMRRSAETVAEALGLTRFTVYNYLNRLRGGGSADSAG